jgi:hypothetical protein
LTAAQVAPGRGSEAGLIVVGEPTIGQAPDKAIAGAAGGVKRFVDATTGEIAANCGKRSRVKAERGRRQSPPRN